jgi:hypothetical protein
LGRCGRQKYALAVLKIEEWELIFGLAVKVISSPGVRVRFGKIKLILDTPGLNKKTELILMIMNKERSFQK